MYTPEQQKVCDYVRELFSKWGHGKCYLDDPECFGQSVWVVFPTQEDHDIYHRKVDEGDYFNVVLDNNPLGWGNKKWGDTVRCRAYNGWKAFADLSDNEVE